MFKPGEHLSAAKLNDLADQVARLGNLSVSPPLQLTHGPYGWAMAWDDGAFWATVTANSTPGSPGPAHVVRQIAFTASGFEQVQPVREVTATEVNGQVAADGSVVRVWLSDGRWVFSAGGGGSGGGSTVHIVTVTGSPSGGNYPCSVAYPSGEPGGTVADVNGMRLEIGRNYIALKVGGTPTYKCQSDGISTSIVTSVECVNGSLVVDTITGRVGMPL